MHSSPASRASHSPSAEALLPKKFVTADGRDVLLTFVLLVLLFALLNVPPIRKGWIKI